MSSAASRPSSNLPRPDGARLRVAFLGAGRWLSSCAPPVVESPHWRVAHFNARPLSGEQGASVAELTAFAPHATVVLDPAAMPQEFLRQAPGVSLGVLVSGAPAAEQALRVAGLSRLLSFNPALSGTAVAEAEIWRAVPPPVSDLAFFDPAPGARPRRRPRAMTIGRATEHREAMLSPAKHHHELLHVVSGVYGQELRELLGEYDIAVHVPSGPGTGFGTQIPLHLAAGQLLLAGELAPAHGLERNLDYLQVDSPAGLVWVLDRLARFPQMHDRIRLRGRMKAEQYRASRVFARLVHDLLADVAAFGPTIPAQAP